VNVSKTTPGPDVEIQFDDMVRRRPALQRKGAVSALAVETARPERVDERRFQRAASGPT
jgi:hypothetical protein